jgi:hypothetical protein
MAHGKDILCIIAVFFFAAGLVEGQDQTYIVAESNLLDHIIPMGSPSYQEAMQYVSGYAACTNISGVISKAGASEIPGGIEGHAAWECGPLSWVVVGNGIHHIEPSPIPPTTGHRFNSTHGIIWQSTDSVLFFGLES